MANYASVIATINSNINSNGAQEITGPVLNAVLRSIVNSYAPGYLFAGIAKTSSSPGTPDYNACWLAAPGSYPSYGNAVVPGRNLGVLKYNGTWSRELLDLADLAAAGIGLEIGGDGHININIGLGLKVNDDNALCVKPKAGLEADDDGVGVKAGQGIQADENGTGVKAGLGLGFSDTGELIVKLAKGLTISEDESGAIIIKNGVGLKFDEDGNLVIDLVAGDFIDITGNTISCTLDANPFYFVTALPEAPPEGKENKLFGMASGTGFSFYQWNASTSKFDLVGSIDLSIDSAALVLKGQVNEADGPTTLSANAAYQLGLRNTISRFVGINLNNGAGDGSNVMQVRSKAGNPETDSFMQLVLNKGKNILAFGPDGLEVNSTSAKLMYIIQAPDGNYWTDIGATFTIPGLFNFIKNKGNTIAYSLRNPNGKTIYDAIAVYIPGAEDALQRITLSFVTSGNLCAAYITSDDTVTIYTYTRRYVAATYGISSWYNASGTSLALYNDLRSLIAGKNNVEGTLGFLCDSHNTFVITGINTTTSGSITTLTVSFAEANSQNQNTLIIDSTGAFSVRRWPKVIVLWADDYNLITSGMPRPDAWLVADGTDVSFYNEVSGVYKYGYQLILKEYSYGYSGKRNQYTVKNILDLGTGYQLFYESNGLQYILAINSDGSMDVTSNLFSAADAGIDTFFPTSNKMYQSVSDFTKKITRVYNASMPIFLKTKNNDMMLSEDARVPIINTHVSTGGSITMYYIKVESSRINEYSLVIYPNGSATVNILSV